MSLVQVIQRMGLSFSGFMARAIGSQVPAFPLGLPATPSFGGPIEGLPKRRLLPSLVAQTVRAVEDIYALARDSDPRSNAADSKGEADIVEARLLADRWQARAEAAEARVALLEAQLEASEMTALELRSRVVCLHGKLATASATVRYQSMTLALEAQMGPEDMIDVPPDRN